MPQVNVNEDPNAIDKPAANMKAWFEHQRRYRNAFSTWCGKQHAMGLPSKPTDGFRFESFTPPYPECWSQ